MDTSQFAADGEKATTELLFLSEQNRALREENRALLLQLRAARLPPLSCSIIPDDVLLLRDLWKALQQCGDERDTIRQTFSSQLSERIAQARSEAAELVEVLSKLQAENAQIRELLENAEVQLSSDA